MRKTTLELLSRKGICPVSMLTAYDYPTARIIDERVLDDLSDKAWHALAELVD